MTSHRSNTRVGVYIDVANLTRNGGYGMRYEVLREFACRGNAEPVRLNAYVSYDADRAETDLAYREAQQGFYSLLRDFGYKVIQRTSSGTWTRTAPASARRMPISTWRWTRCSSRRTST